MKPKIGTVRVACQGADVVSYKQLKPFQGELKSLSGANYMRFRDNILLDGITAPSFVWKHDGALFTLDGHQRNRVYEQMEKDGYVIPPIPIDYVEADSIQQAKRILLSMASQYGTIEKQGLYEFMTSAELGFDDLDRFVLPQINLDEFKDEYFGEPATPLPSEDESNIPVLPVEPKTKDGEIYQLGAHRLICGDSTSLSVVQRLMDGQKADMVWTDPPYNVAYEGATAEALTMKNDNMTSSQFYNFLLSAYQNMLAHTVAGGAIYVAHADTEGVNFRRAMQSSGWLLKQCLIWAKNSLVMGRQDYHWKHEPILYGWAPGAAHKWFSDRTQTTVLEFNRPTRSTDHPTMKPVNLIEYCLGNSLPPNGKVLDLFGGSGSTLIAAERRGGVAYLCELDPRYCDVIIQRWENLTGLKTTLVAGPEGKISRSSRKARKELPSEAV